jgi:predicted MFS family arabinose efflux permease
MLWGLGVACGSLLAGLVWDRVGGSMVFAAAALVCLLAALLCMGFWPHNTVSPVQKDA